MDTSFLIYNENNELIKVKGTTRANLVEYYKNDFDMYRISKRINEIAPECKGLHLLNSDIVAKVIIKLGEATTNLHGLY